MGPAKSTRLRFRPESVWLVAASLAATGLLFLSQRFRWFAFNGHKGYTVLIALAMVGAVLAAGVLWRLVALVFRWRFQFSLRALLALTVAVALPCSWLAVEMKNARKQHEAVEAIKKIGGSVKYDWELAQGNAIGGPPLELLPPGVALLWDLFGDDFFAEVSFVDLRFTQVTDAWLEDFRGLTAIQVLWLSGTQITDAGLANLKGFTALQGVRLSDTRITDSGLANLKGLTSLQTLHLDITQITDVGLENLRGLTSLRSLHLNSTQITDAGLEDLKGLTELHELEISGTQVTSAGLANLRGLTTLQHLGLERTEITDAGLTSLKGLNALQELYLGDTKVTDKGTEELQQSLPKCAIVH